MLSWSALPEAAGKGGSGGGGGGRGGGGGGGSRGGSGAMRGGSSHSHGVHHGNHNGHHHNHGGGFGGFGYWPGYGYGYYYPDIGFSTEPVYRSSYYAPIVQEETEPVGEPASITLKVPADAEVWFNDTKTKQTGKERHFVTPPLVPGYTYEYQIWASWMDNGKLVTRTRDISLSPGQSIMVEIRGPAPEKP
jgi:uncharacterized protein (TIGR03000 family)